MALVKVLVANLFAGASFQKLEAGQVYDVDDAVAEKWIAQGKVEKSTEKKGEKLTFEVATPSATSSAGVEDLNVQVNYFQRKADHLSVESERKDAEHAQEVEKLKLAHAADMEEANKRAEAAEAALAEAIKKAK